MSIKTNRFFFYFKRLQIFIPLWSWERTKNVPTVYSSQYTSCFFWDSHFPFEATPTCSSAHIQRVALYTSNVQTK